MLSLIFAAPNAYASRQRFERCVSSTRHRRISRCCFGQVLPALALTQQPARATFPRMADNAAAKAAWLAKVDATSSGGGGASNEVEVAWWLDVHGVGQPQINGLTREQVMARAKKAASKSSVYDPTFKNDGAAKQNVQTSGWMSIQ